MTSRRVHFLWKLATNKVLHFFSIGLFCFWLPFLMVTGHWRRALRSFSQLGYTVFGVEVTLVPFLEILALVSFLFYARDKITRKRVFAVFVIAAMFLFSYLMTDTYVHYSLYDIQADYHYAAYALMAVMFFRAFARENRPMWAMVYGAYLTCLAISLLDEGAQRFASDRVFDLNDNAKDSLGAVMGVIVVTFIWQKFGTIDMKRIPRGEPRISAYLKNPACALLLILTATLIFVVVSALFSEPRYWYVVALGTLFLTLVAALLFYISRFRVGWRLLKALAVVLIAAQAVSLIAFWNDGIVYHSSWVTVYRGIPIPIADVLIFPGGMVKPVDKHHIRDLELRGFFMRYDASIILIGSDTLGNLQFSIDARRGSFMFWNERFGRYVQVIVVAPEEACELYNRFREEGKRVITVLHPRCGGFFY